MGRIGRRVLIFAALPLLASAVFFGIIQANQRVAKYQAERLLDDIRSISLHHTTFNQVQAILSHWTGSVTYTPPCSSEHCSVWIFPKTFLPYSLYAYGYRLPLLGTIYRYLGWNLGGAGAQIIVRNGSVWDERYQFEQFVPTTFLNDQGKVVRSENRIGGTITTVRGSFMPYFPEDDTDYRIARMFPFALYEVSLSSYASAKKIGRLWQFNFSCLTRWPRACQLSEEIMPFLLTESARRERFRRVRNNENPSCSLDGVRIVSRDADDAAIVDVIENGLEFGKHSGIRILKVRLLERLKGAGYWQMGTNNNVEVTDSLMLAPVSDVANLRTGNRMILVFGKVVIVGGQVEKLRMSAAGCGVERVPPLDAYSDANTVYLSALAPPVAPSVQRPPRF